MGTIELTIDLEWAGQRIDKVLAETLKNQASRSYIQKAIAKGGLQINGLTVVSAGQQTKVGDVCRLELLPPLIHTLQPSKAPIHILFEDEDLLVLDKSDGQVVHLGNGVAPGTTLVEAVLSHCSLSAAAGPERPGVVHRLDQDTSGVILFAKTDRAYWMLTKMFAERQIRKTYYALVGGVPKLLSGIIDAPIGRSMRDRTAMCVTAHGRPACTHWQVLKTFPKFNQTLLSCNPITGRTHQIRVHLKSIGHPIVGDPKYGKIHGQRLFLHAHQIEFKHPISQENCCFQAPLPLAFVDKLECTVNPEVQIDC